MKMKILLLFMFIGGFLLFTAGKVFAVSYNYTYNFKKFKQITSAFAVKAGVLIKFSKNPSSPRAKRNLKYWESDPKAVVYECHTSLKNKYTCTIYQYTNWYQKGAKNNKPVLTKKIYKQMLFNFLMTAGFENIKFVRTGNGTGYYLVEYGRQPVKPTLSQIYKVAYFKLKNLVENKNTTETQKTFKISDFGLKMLIFNVIQQNYYTTGVGYLKQLISTENIGHSDAFNYMSAIANAENVASNGIGVLISGFNSNTESSKVVYNTVGSFYAKALTARFGELKTSFLKYIAGGAAAHMDISYTTMLENSNKMLNLRASKANRYRLGKLLSVHFSKQEKHFNSVPDVPKFNIFVSMNVRRVGTTLMLGTGIGNYTQKPLAEGTASWAELNRYASYPAIDTKSVNFFSLVYFAMKDFYSNKSNPMAKEILRDIILDKKAAFLNLVRSVHYLNSQKRQNGMGVQVDTLPLFFRAVKARNIKKMKYYIYHTQLTKLANYMGPYAKGYNKSHKIIGLAKLLYYIDVYQSGSGGIFSSNTMTRHKITHYFCNTGIVSDLAQTTQSLQMGIQEGVNECSWLSVYQWSFKRILKKGHNAHIRINFNRRSSGKEKKL